MKHHFAAALAAMLLPCPAIAGTVIFTDNFNIGSSDNLDTSSQTGRKSGLLGPTMQIRSSMLQHGIINDKLRMLLAGTEARVRFHDLPGLGWHNFAAGTEGATIAAEGGMRVEFDWDPLSNLGTNWLSVLIGFSSAEPANRVIDAATDLGIKFQHDGATQIYDNGVLTAGTNFPATMLTRHVVVEYAFTSFADGAGVVANAWVNDVKVVTDKAFTWDGNAGNIRFEIGNSIGGQRLDNFSMTTLTPFVDTDADGIADDWEMAKAGNLEDLAASLGSGSGPGTGDYDGDGLTDVEEFRITRYRSFTGIDPRLADTDGDGLSDYAEINPTAPRLPSDPTAADSDGDGLPDIAETGTGTFVDLTDTGTNPGLVDSDVDHFPDDYEIARGGNPNVAATLPANLPAGVSIGTITNEASTGLVSTETFTHKISGGTATTINGVAVNALTAAVTPANFTWTPDVGGKASIAATNNGEWLPASSGVTGSGNLAMLGSFTYSAGGPCFPHSQRFTFSNLEPGRPYEFRLFIRKWSANTVRPIALKFTNGAEVKDVFVLCDRAAIMVPGGTTETAFYVSNIYTATGTTMTLDAAVPRTASADGSLHMYGMTNRVAGPPADTDADGLPDFWENRWAGNLTTLGASPADADNDGLPDAEEFALSTTYPTLSPIVADNDNDGLTDGAEIHPVAPRVATIPTDSDSDDDGLNDFVESNTGVYVSATDTGTNPRTVDSDGDSFSDGYEVTIGSDPVAVGSRPALAPGLSFTALTTDESAGIDTTKTFTHKISGGYATVNGSPLTVNGVPFDLLSNTITPANFTWTASGGKAVIGALTNNNWVPATGGVTGAGLLQLFGGCTYSPNGAAAGSTQKFTLSGLTPGTRYQASLFIRPWDIAGSGRTIAVTFTNGTEVAGVWPGHNLREDRPGQVLGTGNAHAAYLLNFTYTAQADTLVIDANVPAGAASDNGSLHLYGLMNFVSAPPKPLDFESIVRAPNGSSVTLNIASLPGKVYAVDFSTDAAEWIELTDSVPSLGAITPYIDNVASNLPRALYRVRDVTPPQ